uniref:Uncharacterized protein n=1 Tax=Arundo donax TaxID=35708 RepID=A0A0A9CZX2_ARUDO
MTSFAHFLRLQTCSIPWERESGLHSVSPMHLQEAKKPSSNVHRPIPSELSSCGERDERRAPARRGGGERGVPACLREGRKGGGGQGLIRRCV